MAIDHSTTRQRMARCQQINQGWSALARALEDIADDVAPHFKSRRAYGHSERPRV